MEKLPLILSLLILIGCSTTKSGILSEKAIQAHKNEVTEHQKEQNEQFKNPEKSPLTEEDRAHFTELEFFPINPKYKVTGDFVRTPDEKPFEMPTSTDRKPIYTKYGEAHFMLDGKSLSLNLYQSDKMAKSKEYKKYLFLPFNDLTNGEQTYGGGRYVEVKIPKGKKISIDFNRAYNPYCAYSDRWSCPIPPKENQLEVEILAGVKKFDDH